MTQTIIPYNSVLELQTEISNVLFTLKRKNVGFGVDCFSNKVAVITLYVSGRKNGSVEKKYPLYLNEFTNKWILNVSLKGIYVAFEFDSISQITIGIKKVIASLTTVTI